MDGARFDRLLGALTHTPSRRASRRVLAGSAFGGFLADGVPPVGARKRKKKKTTLCHEGQTLTVSKKGRKTHLAHGDTLGACPTPPPPPASPPPPGPVRTTVTQTFTNATPITIPAGAPVTTKGPASPYPSVINVAGFTNGRILDVNVTLHGFGFVGHPNDANVLLVATHLPGNDAQVMCGVGGATTVQNLTLTLDDQAAAPLPTPLVTGTFKPTSYGVAVDTFPAPAPAPSGNVALGVFNNGNPNGTWQLWVVDDSSTDVGSIAGGWSLQITAEVDA